MTTNRNRRAPGFTRVRPTPDELDKLRAKTEKAGMTYRGPNVYRVACEACGKRIWGSGMGIGSHRRACLGVPPANGNPERHRVVGMLTPDLEQDRSQASVTTADLVDLSFYDAVAAWHRLDDARLAGKLPGIAYLVVRSEADPEPQWAKARRGNWALRVQEVTA